MERKREWFDDNAFWRDMYPFVFSEQRYEEAESVAKGILRLAKPKGNAILDLCCGPARYSVFLAKKGYSVTGVDKTDFLLAKARSNAAKAKVRIEFVKKDMRDFVRPESFDLILNLFTSFGYFDNRSEDKTVLRNIHASLRPGGLFLIDIMGKERLAKIFEPASCQQLPNGSLLVMRHEVFDDWTRMRNEWILISRGRLKSYKFHHWLYSGQELRDTLSSAGFTKVRLYGDFDGTAYGPASKRLVALAQKPA